MRLLRWVSIATITFLVVFTPKISWSKFEINPDCSAEPSKDYQRLEDLQSAVHWTGRTATWVKRLHNWFSSDAQLIFTANPGLTARMVNSYLEQIQISRAKFEAMKQEEVRKYSTYAGPQGQLVQVNQAVETIHQDLINHFQLKKNVPGLLAMWSPEWLGGFSDTQYTTVRTPISYRKQLNQLKEGTNNYIERDNHQIKHIWIDHLEPNLRKIIESELPMNLSGENTRIKFVLPSKPKLQTLLLMEYLYCEQHLGLSSLGSFFLLQEDFPHIKKKYLND